MKYLNHLLKIRFTLFGSTIKLIITIICFFNINLSISYGYDFSKWEPEKYKRPFGNNAPWNRPVKEISLHTESDKYSNLFWNESPPKPGNFNLTFYDYTYPVYHAKDAIGQYTVRSKYNWGNLGGRKIPFNPNKFKAAPGSDGQIIILDSVKGYEYDLWQVDFENNEIHISNGNLIQKGIYPAWGNPGDYWIKENGYSSSRGCGIQYYAMLVAPEEIMQGEIRHALSAPIRNTSGEEYFQPATKIEHEDNPPGIPEGMRFFLDVTDSEIENWINSLPEDLPEVTKYSARIIAKALRDYGWFITDTSGGAGFQFEAYASAREKWKDLGLCFSDSGPGDIEINYKAYPRDLLDGLLKQTKIKALVPSNEYPDDDSIPPAAPQEFRIIK